MTTERFRYKGATAFNTTYAQLRIWAQSCDEVREWMEENLPKEIFEEEKPKLVLKHKHLYRMDGNIYLLASVSDGYQFIALTGPVVGARRGDSGSLEELTDLERENIEADLGPMTDILRSF